MLRLGFYKNSFDYSIIPHSLGTSDGQMPGGGMLKFQIDRYITREETKLSTKSLQLN